MKSKVKKVILFLSVTAAVVFLMNTIPADPYLIADFFITIGLVSSLVMMEIRFKYFEAKYDFMEGITKAHHELINKIFKILDQNSERMEELLKQQKKMREEDEKN